MAITSLAKTFDEFTVGEKMVFPLVTITEAHVVAWAGLSGDFNPLHMNQEYAKTTTTGAKVGGMVPHGQFIAAIPVPPIGHLLAGTAIAFMALYIPRTLWKVAASSTIPTSWENSPKG